MTGTRKVGPMTARKRVVEAPRRRTAPKVHEIRVRVHDEDPDTSFLDQDEFADRRAEFERGDFSFVGVRAEAEVVVEGVLQTLMSGGLWGIESDSSKEYIEDVALEEYDGLREILKAIGVSTSQVPVGDREMIRPMIKWEA
jgi:hypothetical protein